MEVAKYGCETRAVQKSKEDLLNVLGIVLRIISGNCLTDQSVVLTLWVDPFFRAIMKEWLG